MHINTINKVSIIMLHNICIAYIFIIFICNAVIEFSIHNFFSSAFLFAISCAALLIMKYKPSILSIHKTTLYFALIFIIFFFTSYHGIESGIATYYIAIASSLPVVFKTRDFNKILYFIILISASLIINFSTNHLLFYNDTNKSIISLLYFSSFSFTIISSILSTFFIVKRDLDKRIVFNNIIENRKHVNEQDILSLNELAVKKSNLFFLKFTQLYPSFINNIQNNHPQLQQNELEICAYLKLNYTTKEIAKYTNSSVRSIEAKKYRIRKKIGLSTKEDIYMWISKF